jgi:hypothetical protein
MMARIAEAGVIAFIMLASSFCGVLMADVATDRLTKRCALQLQNYLNSR